MKIDLHCHSTHSDGRESVSEVFQYAAESGLDVLALTDHDTMAGWVEGSAEAERHGITFVPGIEITTKHLEVSVHLLAYLPDPNNYALVTRLAEVRDSRETRVERYVENLNREFPELTMDAVRATLAEEGKSVGRPHIADAFVNLGLYKNRTEVFDGPLHKSNSHYVPSGGIHTVEAVKLVRAAGGVPIMAHPLARSGKDKNSPVNITEGHRINFEALIEAGLGGFEVNHREVGPEAKAWLIQLAERFDLITTGSSDYHGILGKDNRLGENTTSLEMLKRIEQQATGSSIQWA
jgi:predicted metal-dependent phosphoesterase TrpH